MNVCRILAKALAGVLLGAGTLLSLVVLFQAPGAGSFPEPGRAGDAAGATAPLIAARMRIDPAELERITVLTCDTGEVRVFRDGIEVEDQGERARLAELASKHLRKLVELASGPAAPPDEAGAGPDPSS